MLNDSTNVPRRRAGSWARERERNAAAAQAPSRVLERKQSPVSSLPSIHDENGDVPSSNNRSLSPAPSSPISTGKTRAPWRRRLCSYRCLIAAVAVLAVYSILVSSWSFTHRADPCVVARETRYELAKLKRMGRHEEPDSFPADWTPELPKIIHHQWKDEDIPEKYKEWHDRWYKLYPEPEYTHMLWTDETGRNHIKEHYPWFLEIYDGYEFEIKRADAVRYFILYHHGGIHADLDYEPLINFYQHLPTDRVGLVESPYQYSESTQNSLMTSPRGDPFWLNVFTELVKNQDKNDVLIATGPRLLDNVRQTTKHPVHILPCENFHRIPLGERGMSPMVTTVLREVLARLYPMKQCGSYKSEDNCQFAKHHNAASWWSILPAGNGQPNV